jgi:hypothetical protein
MSKQTRRYCPSCQTEVLAIKPTPNHILHLLLSIVTGGLWLIFWLMLSFKVETWRCARCGAETYRSGYVRREMTKQQVHE